MIIGPVFVRELVTGPRRARHFLYRTLYAAALLVLMGAAWLIVAGVQINLYLGDMARFGAIIFQILAPLQLALAVFLSALVSASAVSQEKDRRTLLLLLMTRLSNSELVLGKLLASLLNVVTMLLAALPVFMLITLLGGVSPAQVARVFAVSLTTALLAGSLGSTLAFWREKTFQTLSITALAIVLWIGAWEAARGAFAGDLVEQLATAMSPLRAILAASQPRAVLDASSGLLTDSVLHFLIASTAGAAVLNLVAIAKVRVWNPSREVRVGQRTEDDQASIWGVEHDLATATSAGEAARSGHVDSRLRSVSQQSRRVWDNPILWREICTWAYGRKVLIIRVAYLLLFALAAGGLYMVIADGSAMQRGDEAVASIPVAASALAPLFLVSIVIINGLAVTSITNERDGQSLDLLLVTDLSPKEFVLGKLAGVLWVTKEMVVLPMALCAYLWYSGGLTLENLVYVLIGLAVMYLFATTLGVHCGMTYSNSRSAIGVSLGAVFFLFLGIVTCMVMMISFSGSFLTQLTAFSAFMLGGGVGLFVSLGIRNPSAAIMTASLTLPILTFMAIASFVMGGRELTVCLLAAGTYGFTTAAMLIPAIGEFDIAMGRTKGGADE